MKKLAVFALIAGAAAVAGATAAVLMKKREERFNCCRYDAGDLEKDDCCDCQVCGDDLDIEPLSEEPDDADTAEAPADDKPIIAEENAEEDEVKF